MHVFQTCNGQESSIVQRILCTSGETERPNKADSDDCIIAICRKLSRQEARTGFPNPRDLQELQGSGGQGEMGVAVSPSMLTSMRGQKSRGICQG